MSIRRQVESLLFGNGLVQNSIGVECQDRSDRQVCPLDVLDTPSMTSLSAGTAPTVFGTPRTCGAAVCKETLNIV